LKHKEIQILLRKSLIATKDILRPSEWNAYEDKLLNQSLTHAYTYDGNCGNEATLLEVRQIKDMLFSPRGCYIQPADQRKTAGFAVCRPCKWGLDKHQMPKYAIANNYCFGEPPPCLQNRQLFCRSAAFSPFGRVFASSSFFAGRQLFRRSAGFSPVVAFSPVGSFFAGRQIFTRSAAFSPGEFSPFGSFFASQQLFCRPASFSPVNSFASRQLFCRPASFCRPAAFLPAGEFFAGRQLFRRVGIFFAGWRVFRRSTVLPVGSFFAGRRVKKSAAFSPVGSYFAGRRVFVSWQRFCRSAAFSPAASLFDDWQPFCQPASFSPVGSIFASWQRFRRLASFSQLSVDWQLFAGRRVFRRSAASSSTLFLPRWQAKKLPTGKTVDRRKTRRLAKKLPTGKTIKADWQNC
jgi:hypothetical protein